MQFPHNPDITTADGLTWQHMPATRDWMESWCADGDGMFAIVRVHPDDWERHPDDMAPRVDAQQWWIRTDADAWVRPVPDCDAQALVALGGTLMRELDPDLFNALTPN